MRREHRHSTAGFAAALVLTALTLTSAVACSNDAPVVTDNAAPTPQDALRTALAASDPILNLNSVFIEPGAIDQKPYRCSNPDGCPPLEQYVERLESPQGVSNIQIARFYLDNLAASGWRVEGAYCDDGKNQYAVVASKRTNTTKTYPGRFELFAKDTVRVRITMPAFGAESSFLVSPDPTAYPAGICPDNINQAVAAARTAAETATPTTLKTDGTSVAPTAGTSAAPNP